MSTIKVSESAQVLTISLARPEVRNAFDTQMIAELTKTFRSLSARKDIRAVVLRGEGKVFCAGADLNYMKSLVGFSLEENQKDADLLFEMFEALSDCRLPVIALVQGAAFGGALGLIACCDHVIAEEKTQLCFSEVKLGLVPAVISPFVLRKVPLSFASSLMLSGRVFGAASAAQAGLVHEIAKEAELEKYLSSSVAWFLEAGPQAVSATKILIGKVSGQSWAQCRGDVTRTIAERRVSAEGQEGLKSFLEKRAPSWRPSQ